MIQVTDEARDHIREKGGSIYLLDTKPVGLCCGRVAFEPQLTIGVPAKPQGYVRDVINDIQVCIPQTFLGPLSPDHRCEETVRAQHSASQRLAARLTTRIRGQARTCRLFPSFSMLTAGSAQGPFFHLFSSLIEGVTTWMKARTRSPGPRSSRSARKSRNSARKSI